MLLSAFWNYASYISNIGFFGRPLNIYQNMIPGSFPLDVKDTLLVVPGGPSPILDALVEKGLDRANILLVDILYGATEKELREITITWRNNYFTNKGINFDLMIGQFSDIILTDDQLKIIGDYIQSQNNMEFKKFMIESDNQFYKEYNTYPENFVKGDITNLNNLDRTFNKIWVTNLLHLYKKDLSEEFHLDAYYSLIGRLNIGGSIFVYPIEEEDKTFIMYALIPSLLTLNPNLDITLEESNLDSELNQGLSVVISGRPNTQYLKITRII